MTAIISDGASGATGTHAATGVTEVIASGAFGAASVQIELANDGQASAPVHTFGAPGAISLQCAGGATITATVVGGQDCAVDVTCNPQWMSNTGFILTFSAMMLTVALTSCTQLGKGDRDTRVVDVVMRATADECFVEVKGNFAKEVTDDTVTVNRSIGK